MAKTIHHAAYQELIATLVAARSHANLTQQDVADRIGRPQSYIAKVEGLERRLDIIELFEIAAAIDFDPMPSLEGAWKHISEWAPNR